MISNVIREAHKAGAKIGLCGQAPSHTIWLSPNSWSPAASTYISVSPDQCFIAVKRKVAARRQGRRRGRYRTPFISADVAVEALRWASASYSGVRRIIGAYPVIRCLGRIARAISFRTNERAGYRNWELNACMD